MKKLFKMVIVFFVIIISLLVILFRRDIFYFFDIILNNHFNIDMGVRINNNVINLDEYTSNINIYNGGEYTIRGEFSYSIIVSSREKVVLNLDNVSINSNAMSAIANLREGELVINLIDNTVNILKNDGKSEYDGCIYSRGKLIIQGNGELNIYGKQKDGEGIATTDNDIYINGGKININSKDDGINTGGELGGNIYINGGDIYIKAKGDGIDSNQGLIINGGKIYTIGSTKGGDAGIDTDELFEINGGEIIAIGTDMLQIPDVSSKQKYISFSLDKKIELGTNISLKNSKGHEIINFISNEEFKTLILSNSKLSNDTYYIYINGKKSEFSKKVD